MTIISGFEKWLLGFQGSVGWSSLYFYTAVKAVQKPDRFKVDCNCKCWSLITWKSCHLQPMHLEKKSIILMYKIPLVHFANHQTNEGSGRQDKFTRDW